MEHDSKLAEPRCLDARYSTTRLVVDTAPAMHNGPGCKFKSLRQLPGGEGRQGEGGLRTKGLYKSGFPNKPLVTVITVVFNGALTLEDTIQSVINQTYDNVEYIVVDGGSTDATLDILRQYEGNIDYWVSEKDAGLYDAMNKGIALAKGDYIGMLNSDDFFTNSWVLEKIATSLASSNVDAVFSCLNIVDPANLAQVLRKYRIASLNAFLLRIGVMPPHPTFYCKRTVYEKVGRYRTDYRVAADFEMIIRMFIKEKMSSHFLDEVTINMRAGGISNDGLVGQIQQNFEIVRACRENGFYTNIFLIALKLPLKLLQFITAMKRGD